jgi:hypothetical protein
MTPEKVRISEALCRHRNAEFKYGSLDCCLFVADVLRDLHGRDFASKWRGTYHSEIGALRIVARYGGLKSLVSSVFGEMIPTAECKDGSPILLSRKLYEQDAVGGALGVRNGGVVVYLTQNGLAEAPITWSLGGWNV